MPNLKVGDYVIATKDKEPYFKNWLIKIIPKESVGRVTCVTIDKYVKYLNVIWISDEIDEEYIPVSIDGLKKISKKEYIDRAMVFSLGSEEWEKKKK